MQSLIPEHPAEAGVEEEIPDQSHVEGAELLANEARAVLREQRFADDEIREWAWTYIADEGSGDVESFLTWVADREYGRQE